MTHQKFDTYSEALQHVNEEEAARIQSQIDYNKVDATRSLKGHQRDAISWHVIEGKLYYVFQCDIKIMHRLELGMSVIHDGPFYRLNWYDDIAWLCYTEDGEVAMLKRDMKARKYYAKKDWVMTTESSLYFDEKSSRSKATI
tara:strand:- start:361 stop:786 length:426 start_codon:yes stop_codon:yes gene_type:complete